MKYQGMHNNKSTIVTVFIMLFLLPILSLSCGSSGGGGGFSFAGGGISGTGISSGAITGFGSVILNNSTYGVTSSTNISVNDTAGLTQNDLKRGMVAVVGFSGTNATSIDADNELKGTVDNVNAANNILTVMGNQVIVDNDTVFDNISPASLSGLIAGNNVEVHGLFDFLNNTIRATRLEKIAQPAPGEFEVKGTIAAGSLTGSTFSIGTLLVDFATNGVSLQGAAEGSFVEVKGDLIGGTLIAVSLERENEIPGINPNDEFEIEGIITSIDNPQNPAQIVMNGVTVLIGGAEFENGDLADLIIGVKAEAEGAVNAFGQLVADKIKFRDSVKIETTVDSVDVVNNTITVFGTVNVKVTPFTELEDDRDNVSPFTINNIQPNDFLEIQGFPDSASSMVALEIERDNNPDRAILQGAVQSVSNPNLTILGVNVNTSGITTFEINDTASSAAAFFGTVQAGDIVKAKEDPAVLPVNTLTAIEVSLEGDDD